MDLTGVKSQIRAYNFKVTTYPAVMQLRKQRNAYNAKILESIV